VPQKAGRFRLSGAGRLVALLGSALQELLRDELEQVFLKHFYTLGLVVAREIKLSLRSDWVCSIFLSFTLEIFTHLPAPAPRNPLRSSHRSVEEFVGVCLVHGAEEEG